MLTFDGFAACTHLSLPRSRVDHSFRFDDLVNSACRTSCPIRTDEKAMKQPESMPAYEIADLNKVPPQPCPCGVARRAFTDVSDFPATLHVTEISETAQLHYHKTLTETYFFLECGPDAQMQLDEQIIPVKPGMSILIRPGTRHRAIGKMKVLIFVLPKFDPNDEWFDEP